MIVRGLAGAGEVLPLGCCFSVGLADNCYLYPFVWLCRAKSNKALFDCKPLVSTLPWI